MIFAHISHFEGKNYVLQHKASWEWWEIWEDWEWWEDWG